MTERLTAESFADVPWGGRAMPPEGSLYTGAVRLPEDQADDKPWAVRDTYGSVFCVSDARMADQGWALPDPADPWDTAPDMLQSMWDTGEERDGEDEWGVVRYDNGSLSLEKFQGKIRASSHLRFRPRPRPAWQDAEVVEASTESNPERRLFRRVKGGGWVDDSWFQSSDTLIDPVPMTVQKENDR